jgi:hypothetical protein
MKPHAHHAVAAGAVALGLLAASLPSPTHAASLLVAGFAGDAIAEYDRATGALLGIFASHPSMDGPTAMVYGADGNLYVLNEFSKNVLRFNGLTGAFIDEFISMADLTAAGVPDPGDMELGADGHLYLMSHFSTAAAAIWKFDGASGAFLSPFATFGAVSHTHGLTLGPGDKWYMSDLGAGVVRQFDVTTGADLGVFATDGALSLGADLEFAPDGTLYVTADGGTGVRHFSSGGASLPPLIAPGASESYWGILVDDGDLFLGNKATGVVKQYTDTGVFVADLISGVPGPFDILPKAVPEPGAAALLFMSAALLSARRRQGGGAPSSR